MVISVIAIFSLFYSFYIYTDGTEAPHIELMDEEGRYGQVLYQEYNCTACHQFYGLGGYMGPDLTNVISNRGEAVARIFLSAGSIGMPNFGFNEDQVSALIAYLKFVDKTGTYPPKIYEMEWYGMVTQEDDPK